MVEVRFFSEGVVHVTDCGTDLRTAAQQAGVNLYRSWHRLANCRGRGRCGSCRIEVSDPGAVAPAERTAAERRHLDRDFSDATTRLACQVTVAADVVVLTQEQRRQRLETGSFIPRGF